MEGGDYMQVTELFTTFLFVNTKNLSKLELLRNWTINYVNINKKPHSVYTKSDTNGS